MFEGGFWFEFEQHLNQLYTENRHVVWAIFDCDRTESKTKAPDNDEDLSEEENAAIITYAASLGQRRPSATYDGSSFTERLEMYFTKFLHEGQGSFSLTDCLEKIPLEIANTQLSFVPFCVKLWGENPKDRTWSGSVDSSGKF